MARPSNRAGATPVLHIKRENGLELTKVTDLGLTCQRGESNPHARGHGT